MNLNKLRDSIDTSWWFIPLVWVIASIAVAIGMIRLDEGVQNPPAVLAYSGSAGAARTVLSTLNSGVLTFTALTFSITVVILVLTSGQFSPRVLRTFLSDRPSQMALGLFVGTYVYILVVLREVRGPDVGAGGFVPAMAVTLGFGLTGASVLMFVYFVHHIAHSVRAATVIERIADDTRETILNLYPSPSSEGSSADQDNAVDAERVNRVRNEVIGAEPFNVVRSSRAGVVNSVSIDRLVAYGRSADTVLVVLPRIGDNVRTDATLIKVHRSSASSASGAASVGDLAALRTAVALQREASVRVNAAFGFRQLVDMAERALSPGVNDPTTAVQCVDAMHDLLYHLAIRPFPPGFATDDDGTVRVIHSTWSWDDYVHLAFDEIRHWGAESLQIHRQLRHVLEDLIGVVGPDSPRRLALEHQRELLDRRLDDLPDAEQTAAQRTADMFDPTRRV